MKMMESSHCRLQYKSFENTVGKGEIARIQQFLLFPVFSTHLENFLPFSLDLILSSANFLSLEDLFVIWERVKTRMVTFQAQTSESVHIGTDSNQYDKGEYPSILCHLVKAERGKK